MCVLPHPIGSNRADRLDTCIGYNALYVIPGVDNSNGKDLPDGFRLWCWLILFDDGMRVRDVGFPLMARNGCLNTRESISSTA